MGDWYVILDLGPLRMTQGTYPGTLSTQSPHPLFLLNIDNIPSCVPTTIFVPLYTQIYYSSDKGSTEDNSYPLIGTIDNNSSSWSSDWAKGSVFLERTSSTDNVPSPLQCSEMVSVLNPTWNTPDKFTWLRQAAFYPLARGSRR
jgi:hypothetical protein